VARLATEPGAGRRWQTRLTIGFIRIVLLGLIVGVVCVSLANLADGVELSAGAGTSGGNPPGVAVYPFFLCFFRGWVDLGAVIRQWARTRLQRQLMVSYVLVIMMTFVGLVGVGSVTAGLIIVNDLPGPESQARAIAETLKPSPGMTAVDPARAQQLLQGLEDQQIRPVDFGGSPVNLFLPWTLINRRTEIVASDGKLLAVALRPPNNEPSAGACDLVQPVEILPPAQRQRLIEAALQGRVTSVQVATSTPCSSKGVVEIAAAAPILDAHGRPIAVVLNRGAALAPSWLWVSPPRASCSSR